VGVACNPIANAHPVLAGSLARAKNGCCVSIMLKRGSKCGAEWFEASRHGLLRIDLTISASEFPATRSGASAGYGEFESPAKKSDRHVALPRPSLTYWFSAKTWAFQIRVDNPRPPNSFKSFIVGVMNWFKW